MDVLEMHIEIDQKLQEINSNVTSPIKAHEKDLALISAEDIFIKSRLRPRKNGSEGFEVDQRYTDDIQSLFSYKKIECLFDDKLGLPYVNLPWDYNYLLRDKSYILTDKHNEFNNSTNAITKYITPVKFSNSNKDNKPFFEKLNIAISSLQTSGVKFSLENYLTGGLNSNGEKFIIRDLILKELNKEGFSVYWEKWNDFYKSDSFIFVSDINQTIDYIVDNTTISSTTQNRSYRKYSISDKSEFSKENRTYKNNMLDDIIENNSYYRTYPTSPISTLSDNKLTILVDERFIVNSLIVYYIRKPRRMSLLLNQSCELPSSVHQDICKLAAEVLEGNINANSLEQTIKSNVIRLD